MATTKWQQLTDADRKDAILHVACPRCKAGIGFPCVGGRNEHQLSVPHTARVKAAAEWVNKPEEVHPPTLREALDYIDNILVQQDETSQQLWAVMTALRGPDNPEKDNLKYNGTIFVRRAAFPLTTAKADSNPSVFTRGYSNGAAWSTIREMKVPTAWEGHAESHLYHAMHTLGLDSPRLAKSIPDPQTL